MGARTRVRGLLMENAIKPAEQVHILVVDDDALVLRMTQIVLDDLGYRVRLATSAAEAMQCIEADRGAFDLVVLDQRLPDREGLSVLREAKARYPSLRFMLVTGYATEEVVQEMMAAGAVKVLDKPYDIDQFADAVRVAMTLDP
jgi:two-component system cell cycle sensor histidine kinase/response regulator CckA